MKMNSLNCVIATRYFYCVYSTMTDPPNVVLIIVTFKFQLQNSHIIIRNKTETKTKKYWILKLKTEKYIKLKLKRKNAK